VVLQGNMEQDYTEQPASEQTSDNRGVFIGLKPFMNYVTAVVMQFTTKNAAEVTVKARGKFISRAVDVVEVATKRFLEGQVDIKNIATSSEEFKNREGRDVRVSTIEITLAKK
jgi:archaea-specific DNA-binding protein